MKKGKLSFVERVKGSFGFILYGIIWGLTELTLGSFLHFIHYPQTGSIMAAIAYTIMLIYLVRHRRKSVLHPFYMGLIAACFKFFNVFIFGVPIFHRSIVNPALSIVVEASLMTLGAFLVVRIAKVLKVRENYRT